MTDVEVSEGEAAAQIQRAAHFIAQLRQAIAATEVDPKTAYADDKRQGLERIAATVDAVPFGTMCNELQRENGRRIDEANLRASNVRRCWPDNGSHRRYGFPRCVPADDRLGAGAAAAMRAKAVRDVSHVAGLAKLLCKAYREAQGRVKY